MPPVGLTRVPPKTQGVRASKIEAAEQSLLGTGYLREDLSTFAGYSWVPVSNVVTSVRAFSL